MAELSYVLVLARDLNYIRQEEWGELEALRDHAGRLTWGLYRSLSGKPRLSDMSLDSQNRERVGS
jgi:hypothetical protein